MTNDEETSRFRGQRASVSVTLADLVTQLKLAEERGVSRANYATSLGVSEDTLSLLLTMAVRNAGLSIEHAKRILGAT